MCEQCQTGIRYFDGPQVMELMKDVRFSESMENNEGNVWISFQSTVTNSGQTPKCRL